GGALDDLNLAAQLALDPIRRLALGRVIAVQIAADERRLRGRIVLDHGAGDAVEVRLRTGVVGRIALDLEDAAGGARPVQERAPAGGIGRLVVWEQLARHGRLAWPRRLVEVRVILLYLEDDRLRVRRRVRDLIADVALVDGAVGDLGCPEVDRQLDVLRGDG